MAFKEKTPGVTAKMVQDLFDEAEDHVFGLTLFNDWTARDIQAVIDEVRQRRAQKRDGGLPVTLSDENLGLGRAHYDALDVDALLTELEDIDATAAEVVVLRVFGGLSIEEVAEALSISTATANRRWLLGKTWLTRELTKGP